MGVSSIPCRFFLLLKLHILNVRGNVPDVAEWILHARYAVAIGLVRRLGQRGGTCLEGTLVNGVYIVVSTVATFA
jgi:hypothetical protein